MLYCRQLHFQFLEDVSPLTQEASSVLTNWRGVAGFYTLRGSVLTESLRARELSVSEGLEPLVGICPNRPSCGLGEPLKLCIYFFRTPLQETL